MGEWYYYYISASHLPFAKKLFAFIGKCLPCKEPVIGLLVKVCYTNNCALPWCVWLYFQVISGDWICEWWGPDVSYATAKKTPRGTCQVSIQTLSSSFHTWAKSLSSCAFSYLHMQKLLLQIWHTLSFWDDNDCILFFNISRMKNLCVPD